jgi:hypothetical protein
VRMPASLAEHDHRQPGMGGRNPSSVKVGGIQISVGGIRMPVMTRSGPCSATAACSAQASPTTATAWNPNRSSSPRDPRAA